MRSRSIACDTTILLYLGRIDRAGLIPALYECVFVPEPVLLELDMGRVLHPATINPRSCPWARPVPVPQTMLEALPPNHLGAGERAVIAYAHSRDGCVAGLDDLQARQVAESVGLIVAGTLGVLVSAKREGLIVSVRPLLDSALLHGFRISAGLYAEVLHLAGEAP